MTNDAPQMTAGFQLVLSKLGVKELIKFIDEPTIPQDVLLEVIQSYPSHMKTIIETLGDDILTAGAKTDSLYAQLINASVIEKYIDTIAYTPQLSYESHSSRYQAPGKADGVDVTFDFMPAHYMERLSQAAQTYESLSGSSSEALLTSVLSALKSYRSILLRLPQEPVEPDPSTSTRTENQTYQESINMFEGVQKLDWNTIADQIMLFATFTTGNPTLSGNSNITHAALLMLQSARQGLANIFIPEEKAQAIQQLLETDEILLNAQRLMVHFGKMEKRIGKAKDDSDVVSFMRTYKAVSRYLNEYGQQLPTLENDKLTQQFDLFSRDTVKNIALSVAKNQSVEETGIMDLCHTIKTDATLARLFLRTLTSKSDDIGKIARVACALTPE